MDTGHPVPWFPAWGVSFPRPVEDVQSVVSVFNEWRPSNRWLLVAFEVVASEVHLWTTWYALKRGEESGSMVANSPDAEFLRLISGTHQISKAFERAGLRERDVAAWIVALPEAAPGEEFGGYEIPKTSYIDMSLEADRLIEHLGGLLMPKRPVPSEQGLLRLGVKSEKSGLPLWRIEEYYMSHMALSDMR